MTKKLMLLALASVSATLFAMPSVASANWGVDPPTQTFTGTSEAGLTSVFSAAGEPSFTCEGPSHVSGAWTDGTKGSFTLDATACHVSVFGFTAACKTSAAPLSNTVLTSGSFANVTIAGGKRGITLTPVATTMVCAGLSTMKVSGTIIGRITEDPASCGAGVIDNGITLEFLLSAGVQTPLSSDAAPSVKDDLSAQTGSGALITAGLESRFVLSTVSNTTWTCNAP